MIANLFTLSRNEGLAFRAHAEFKQADLDARQKLYRALAEQIWYPANLMREMEA